MLSQAEQDIEDSYNDVLAHRDQLAQEVNSERAIVNEIEEDDQDFIAELKMAIAEQQCMCRIQFNAGTMLIENKGPKSIH
jgi:hypothetical protein